LGSLDCVRNVDECLEEKGNNNEFMWLECLTGCVFDFLEGKANKVK